MKLLFDENLSHRLIVALTSTYPGATHVRNAALLGASDGAVWDYAREFGFTVVSKDNDFRQRSFFEGSPPKVIWLAVGNSGTDAIAELLLASEHQILAFELDQEASCSSSKGSDLIADTAAPATPQCTPQITPYFLPTF